MNTNPKAKVILCYGDSNTWGADPDTDSGDRHPADVRWTGVLQDTLGRDYEVVGEGLCGRTFVAEESGKEYRTGITHLRSILQTNEPIDILTIMLGTNDMKSTFGLAVDDIINHLRKTIQFIQQEKVGPNESSPKIIVICPPPVVNPVEEELDERLRDAPKTSLLLPPLYKKVAEEFGCLYINAGDFISLQNTDGYHLAKQHHKILGEEIAEIIRQQI